MEASIIFEFWEGILQSAGGVEPIVGRDTEAASGRVPKHDPIGVITTSQGNTGPSLSGKFAAGCAGAFYGLTKIAGEAPWKRTCQSGSQPYMRVKGVVRVEACFSREERLDRLVWRRFGGGQLGQAQERQESEQGER
jgi:hypothetical protein